MDGAKKRLIHYYTNPLYHKLDVHLRPFESFWVIFEINENVNIKCSGLMDYEYLHILAQTRLEAEFKDFLNRLAPNK